MKNFVTVLLIFAGYFLAIDAQKIAVVDVQSILSDMKDYKEAQTELDKIAAEWRQEISAKHDHVKKLYNQYQADEVLLTDVLKRKREEEIVNAEDEVRDLNKRKFGPEGELFLKRQELIYPIQDKVFNSIKSYAQDFGFDIILDKSSSTGLLFANENFDKTEQLKRKLSIK